MPGTLLAGRYRIVTPLGRGGMGEVYRADDLKLGHAVALKFLSPRFADDSAALQRLYAEVRIGRQVSHPNVCRLYDVGEFEGTQFLTMEYVDGEDLASLLRRIGRLPIDKATEIARELASGLAAAHEAGIVHRDLKPANVMIDGRGRARITDFGLAGTVEELARAREHAGTAAYMAPEQLRGEPATPRSDLYALGLVLFELFTGRRAFEGTGRGELPSISSVVRDIDPAIARVVEQCLDAESAARPSSARSVLGALPGGDPLAAALAAGETPSPEMVAAAGETGQLRADVAWPLFALAVAVIVALALLSNRTMLYRVVGLPKSPEALRERAQDIAERLGYTTPIADSGGEWIVNADLLRWIGAGRAPMRTRPAVYNRVVRLSTWPLLPVGRDAHVTAYDPAPLDPGMIDVTLDPDGKLVRFAAVPPDRVPPQAANDVDWRLLFAEAGADPARFHAVSPVWSAGQFAWDGTFANQPRIPIHIEAAAQAGRAASFRVYGPWDEPRPLRAMPHGLTIASAGDLAKIVVLALGTIIGAFFAAGNLRRGRGDRKGALRVAAFCSIALACGLVLRADHRSILDGEWRVLEGLLGRALYAGGTVWLMYMAVEPYLRRRWPQIVIAWSRALAGRWRDPMVGRDVLAGVLFGLAVDLALNLTRVVPGWFGLVNPPPVQRHFYAIEGLAGTAWYLLYYIAFYVQAALACAAIVVLLRVIFRSRLLAGALFFIIAAPAFLNAGIADSRILLPYVAFAGIVVLVALRFGLLALVVAGYVWGIGFGTITLDTSAWYFGRSLLIAGVIVALAFYGAIVSIGNKPLFDEA